MWIYIPLHHAGRYCVVIIHKKPKAIDDTLALFDPNPITPWSQQEDWKRWHQKLAVIWPKYRYAMQKIYGMEVRDSWFWHTPVLDKRFKNRDR